MRLVVTEKPSVARDIARVLGAREKGEGFLQGGDLRITWCVGHLAELQDPVHYDPNWRRWSFDTLPMVPERFELRPRSSALDHWKILRVLLRDRSYSSVINACDAGREGELIFRFVYELSGCRADVQRLWVSSLTDEAILAGWRSLRPGSQYDALGDAARCRAEADWLVGLNATRAMTCLARKSGGEQLLSVGRVQTPTLAMICARDAEIEAFVPETYWTVKATFNAEAGKVWVGDYFRGMTAKDSEEHEKVDEEAALSERLPSEWVARAVVEAVQGREGRVASVERRATREPPPLLYDLTSLQRRANERYGYSAAQTLAIAQALYEKHKLITYPRTDARYLTPDQVAVLPEIVVGVGKVPVYRPFAEALLQHPIRPGRRVVDASEVGDHHAILPTGKTPDANRLSIEEKRIFDLVARRLLAVLSAEAVFDVATLVVEVEAARSAVCEGVDSPLRFRSRGRVCRQQGWRAVDPPGRSRETELPMVDEGELARVRDAAAHEGTTRPPRHYNDATLLRSMETAGRTLDSAELKRAMRHAGLGTPATRADILSTLAERKFIERRGRDLVAMPLGRLLIHAIPVDELKSAELTGRWEARLAAIAEGREDRSGFMADVVHHLRGIVNDIQAAEPPPSEVTEKQVGAVLGSCPVCGTSVREGRQTYSCEKGRNCAFVVFRVIAKRKISGRMVKQLLDRGRSDVVKGFKSKAGKTFDAALAWREGKVTFVFEERGEVELKADRGQTVGVSESPVGMPCPGCKQGKLLRGRAAWGCDRWREGCNYVLPFESQGRLLTDREAVAQLLPMLPTSCSR